MRRSNSRTGIRMIPVKDIHRSYFLATFVRSTIAKDRRLSAQRCGEVAEKLYETIPIFILTLDDESVCLGWHVPELRKALYVPKELRMGNISEELFPDEGVPENGATLTLEELDFLYKLLVTGEEDAD